jgi:hypothetical protein
MKSGSIVKTFENIDLTAIRLFFSFIAILFAGILHNAQALTTTTDNITPVETLMRRDLKCPIPNVANGCSNESEIDKSHFSAPNLPYDWRTVATWRVVPGFRTKNSNDQYSNLFNVIPISPLVGCIFE